MIYGTDIHLSGGDAIGGRRDHGKRESPGPVGNGVCALAGVTWLVGASSRTPKCCGFDL